MVSARDRNFAILAGYEESANIPPPLHSPPPPPSPPSHSPLTPPSPPPLPSPPTMLLMVHSIEWILADKKGWKGRIERGIGEERGGLGRGGVERRSGMCGERRGKRKEWRSIWEERRPVWEGRKYGEKEGNTSQVESKGKRKEKKIGRKNQNTYGKRREGERRKEG